MAPQCLSFFHIAQLPQKSSTLWSMMAQTVDFFPSNSSTHLIGSDMPVKLRDGEQTHLSISRLILALTRGLSPVRIEEHWILKSCFCWVVSVISFSWMHMAWVKSGYPRLTSSLIPVYSNSCNCIWLRMACVLTWGYTLNWSCLQGFVKEHWVRIRGLSSLAFLRKH